MNANKYQHHTGINKQTLDRYLKLYKTWEIARETRNRERAYLLNIDLQKMRTAYPKLRNVA